MALAVIAATVIVTAKGKKTEKECMKMPTNYLANQFGDKTP